MKRCAFGSDATIVAMRSLVVVALLSNIASADDKPVNLLISTPTTIAVSSTVANAAILPDHLVDGKLSIIPRDQWFELVKNRESPKAAGKARDDMILAIDLIGPEMAHVKLKCAVPPRYFTDILSFLKIQDQYLPAGFGGNNDFNGFEVAIGIGFVVTRAGNY